MSTREGYQLNERLLWNTQDNFSTKVRLLVSLVYRGLVNVIRHTRKLKEEPIVYHLMRHTTNNQRLTVIFERPLDWLNVFSQTFWLGTDICHAKLLFQNGGKWFATELVYEGVQLYEIYPDEGWYVVEAAKEAYSFDVSPRFGLTILNRSMVVKGLGLSWSNWYAVHALLNGKFPSLNCVSYLSYLLFGDVEADLPDKLRSRLEEIKDE